MRDGHGSVAAFCFLHQQKRDRLADNHTAAEHHDMCAGDVDFGFDKQALNAKRCARNETALVTHGELCHVQRVKAVDVFARIERANNCRFVNVLWRRRLNEDSVNIRITIQFLDVREQIVLRSFGGQLQLHRMQSKLAAHFIF